eukprot:scpid21049/ scgid16354/ Chondroitin sulfate N-acetylgalactosaminyltransferase 1; Chondroitin beta-1,4-N-acetylgalactosaminyltransferase 1
MLFASRVRRCGGDGDCATKSMRFSAVRTVKLLVYFQYVNLLLIMIWMVVARCYHTAWRLDEALSAGTETGGNGLDNSLDQLACDIDNLHSLLEEKRQGVSKLEEIVRGEQAPIRRDEPPTRVTVSRPLSGADVKAVHTRIFSMARESEHDVVPWSVFNRTHYHHTQGRETGGLLTGWRLREVQLVLRTAVHSLPSSYTADGFTDGFRFLMRRYGIAYELFFTSNKSKTDVRRVRIMRALGRLATSDLGMSSSPSTLGKLNDYQRALTAHPHVNSSRFNDGHVRTSNQRVTSSLHKLESLRRPLHFVLLVTGRKKHLIEFLHSFIVNVLGVKTGAKYVQSVDVHLTIVAMTPDSSLANKLEVAVKERCRAIDFDRVTFKWLADKFDTELALRAAMDLYGAGDNAVMSLINVDMRFNKESVKRCRNLPERGRRVYWPVSFRLYNVRLAHGASAVKVKLEKRFRLSPSVGFWAEQDYDVFCMFASDLTSALGNLSLDSETRQSLPLFTLAIYRQFARSGSFRSMRLPDRTLIRLYRPMRCALNAVPNPVEARAAQKRYDQCREHRARNLAPHKTLAYLALGPRAARDKLFAAERLLLDEMENR